MASFLPRASVAGIVLEMHLSVKAAAETSGYTEQYVRRLLRAGRLEGTRVGQVWLIKLASLEAHLQKGFNISVFPRTVGSMKSGFTLSVYAVAVSGNLYQPQRKRMGRRQYLGQEQL
jgi:excisionase family DNA binding protein